MMMPLRAERYLAGSRLGRAIYGTAALLVAAVACSNSPQRPMPSRGSAAASMNDRPAAVVEPCESGDERACYVTVGVDGREMACYEGVETCDAGEWGECEDGEVVSRAAPKSWVPPTGSGFLALSSSGDCENNPCNPRCQDFDEVPAPILIPNGDPPEGVIGGLPSGAPEQVDCYWGNDCQYDYRCDAPLSGDGCSHNKCETGSALSSSCRSSDPCVDAICAETPECCSDTWSAACVAKVHSVCDTFCMEETIACDHRPCVAGSKLVCNDPCVEAVCAFDFYCCDVEWDNECILEAGTTSECSPVVPPTSVPSLGAFAELCSYAAFSFNNLDIAQNSHVIGRIGAVGNMSITAGTQNPVGLWVGGNLIIDQAQMTGRAVVRGSVQIRNGARVAERTDVTSPPHVLDVDGTVTLPDSGGSLTGHVDSPAAPSVGGSATFSGTWTANTEPVHFSAPTISLATPSECSSSQPATLAADGVLPPNAESANPGAAYAGVTASGTLRLREGRYVFQSVTMNSASSLSLAFGTTGIDIHVCGQLTINPQVTITSPSSFTGLRWFQYGTTTMTLDAQTGYPIPGVFVALNAHVYVSPNTTLIGVVYGKSLKFEPGLNNLPVGYQTEMCAATSGTVCNPSYVPVPTPTPREAGECVPWELGDTDPGCAGFDIGLGMPCKDTLMVCNHGKAQAPAQVELALFSTTVDMSAVSPLADASNADYRGSCYTMRPIAPGQCIEQACSPGLLDSAANVVAIPPTGETECNQIENWTRYDPDVACMCVRAEAAPETISSSDCTVTFAGLSAADIKGLRWNVTGGVTSQLNPVSDAAACTSSGVDYYIDLASEVVLCPTTCSAVVGVSNATLQAIGACEGSPYSSTTIVEDYVATCSDAGTGPQWDMLTWDSSTPNDSSITFKVAIASAEDELNDATLVTVGTASSAQDADGRDTQTCDAFTHREDCPVRLPLFALDETSASWEMPELRYKYLRLSITLDPGAMLWGNDQIPELRAWDLSYSCLDNE